MNALDWFLLVVVLAYALSGYWQGFVTGAFATFGLLIGGLLGIWLAPVALGNAEPVAVGLAGRAVHRDRVRVASARRPSSTPAPGSATASPGSPSARSTRSAAPLLSAFAVLLVAWALGVAISGSRLGSVTPLVRESAVLGRVDTALPSGANQVLKAFDDVVGTTFFPRYLEPFAPSASSRCPRDPGGCSPTPTSSTRRTACSRSAAPTAAAAGSRAAASCTPTTG